MTRKQNLASVQNVNRNTMSKEIEMNVNLDSILKI